MKLFLETGDKIIRKVNNLLYICAVLTLVGMVMNVVLAVLFNKVLSKSFSIPVDYTAYLLLVVASLGYAGYQYKNGFVRVTMLTEHFPTKAAYITEICNFIVLIGFYSFLTYQCFLAATVAQTSGQTMMAISWKLYPYYYILAFGILWTTVVTLFQMIRYIVQEDAADAVSPQTCTERSESV